MGTTQKETVTTDRKFSLTRYAPTPSGYLHLGNILSFALTAAIAAKHGAQILLRIDDLDRSRLRLPFVQDIFDTLHFLELPYHKGPINVADYEQAWSQTHRLHLYENALQKLASDNGVFACHCSRLQLQQTGDVYTGTCENLAIPLNQHGICWRLNTGEPVPIYIDRYNEGVESVDFPAAMQSFVVRKKDGLPAYQLSSIIDDDYFEVDLIIRGLDLWPSTLAQLYLAKQIQMSSLSKVTFYHHPLIMASGGLKLSKSAGDTSIKYLREKGYSSQQVYNKIAATAGFSKPANNWLQLANLFLNNE